MRLPARRLLPGCRIRSGEWLGPWTLCQTLKDAVNRLQPGGLHVYVVSQQGCNGGGAPVLYTTG